MKKEFTLISVILLMLFADLLCIEQILLSKSAFYAFYVMLGVLLVFGALLLYLLGFFVRRLFFKNSSSKI